MKPAKNRAASIRARLKNIADEQRQDFDLTLTRYGLERLLYRLSVSRHAENFVLKGALLFALWFDAPTRPTRDADLLGFGPSDVDTANTVFRELCDIAMDDGIEFDAASVKADEIREEAHYGGVRVRLNGRLDGARISLQIDVGFGDAVTPGPEEVAYRILLDDLPTPKLRAYPKVTVIAEKFHALCLLGMANSRMKDYFDLRFLLRDELDVAQLRTAVETTFARRQTSLPENVPVGLSDMFAEDNAKQTQWRAFIARNKLAKIALPDVVKELRLAFCRCGIIAGSPPDTA